MFFVTLHHQSKTTTKLIRNKTMKNFAVIRIKATNSVEMAWRERYDRLKANGIDFETIMETDDQREMIDFWIDGKY